MSPITLNSSLSYESIQLTPISVGETHGEFELSINGQHWDGDHEHAIRLASESIFLSCNRLRELASKLHAWLESNDCGRFPFTGESSLADDNANAELNLIFAARPDTISSEDRPVVTLIYRIGRLVGEFSFVTDQSCLRFFADEINRTVATTVV
ncbi:MAG: hypothetical protein Aurels2KO_32580 [Aureliella sp.]